MTDFFNMYSFEGSNDDQDDPMDALLIDDSLPLLEKIKRYLYSDLMLHRLYLVRSLGESARILGIESTQENLLPILEDLMPDPEPSLRQALVEQIPEFTKFFVESGEDEVYTTVLHSLIPMVAELTTDRHLQVRTSATESLIQISSIIHQEDLEPYVLPIVKSLSNDATEEEHRLEAAQLLAAISPYLTQELCEQFILPLISKLSEDRVFRVRKAIAANLGELAKSLSEQSILDKIIPIYNKLCSDEIWGVRKACAETLVSMGKCIPSEERYSTLITIFESLVEDESRWVRGSAYQNLGPFISIFDSVQVTPQLLHYYIDMISDIKQAKALGDGEVAMYCAFNFPAVLLTVGKSRWNELSTTYFTLVKDNQWKVRRTLAFSLHEVASILGNDITEHMLLATFELFLKDTDEVKEGVVSNLAHFLTVLSPNVRLKYLDLIQELKASKNWRFRKLIARQLNQLCTIYDIENTNNVIVPLTLHLCQDSFAKVRKVASQGVGLLMKRLVDDNSSLKNEVERQIISFSTHASSFKRQLFIDICENLVNQLEDDLFVSKYLPKLLALQCDKIPNIRQALAKVLGSLIKNEKYSSNTEILTILGTLQQDKDRETRFVSKSALDTVNSRKNTTNENNNNNNNNKTVL